MLLESLYQLKEDIKKLAKGYEKDDKVTDVNVIIDEKATEVVNTIVGKNTLKREAD